MLKFLYVSEVDPFAIPLRKANNDLKFEAKHWFFLPQIILQSHIKKEDVIWLLMNFYDTFYWSAAYLVTII